MASRKQRRRRQKERRHEYEFVYVDDEGQEVDVDPSEVEHSDRHVARRNGTKQPRKDQRGRPARKIDPPSWKKVSRRALIFAPLIFFAFSILNHKQTIQSRLLLTVLYTAFFVPFMYLMDRAMYRSYLRKTGQPKPRPAAGRKR